MALMATLFGAAMAMLLLSRLTLGLLSRFVYNAPAILLAHAATLLLATGLAGYSWADGASPRFAYALLICGPPTLLWLGLDLLVLGERRAKAAIST